MFMKECGSVARSLIYFAFLAVIVLFYVTQLGNYAGHDIALYNRAKAETQATETQATGTQATGTQATGTQTAGTQATGAQASGTHTAAGMASGSAAAAQTNAPPSDNPLMPPEAGQADYGYRTAEIPEQVMPNALARLLVECAGNNFANYATGFYRRVKLSDEQLADIHALLTQMTGLSFDELLARRNEKALSGGGYIDYRDAIPLQVDYETFKENMAHINNMLGGGSYYDPANLKQYGQEAVTYAEKLAEYNDLIELDQITGAYARLFCDYMGICMALFSVFVPVSFLLRDKRARMTELIDSRGKSSAGVVLSRYAALVCMTLLPVLLLSLIPTVQLSVFAGQNGLTVDYFAFVKYIAAWLLPTVLATTAAAYLFTTLTDNPVAILLPFVWGLYGIFTSAAYLAGGRYGVEIAIRHNTLGGVRAVLENREALMVNRLSYTALSVVLVLASVYVYDLKRRGRLHVRRADGKVPKHRPVSR